MLTRISLQRLVKVGLLWIIMMILTTLTVCSPIYQLTGSDERQEEEGSRCIQEGKGYPPPLVWRTPTPRPRRPFHERFSRRYTSQADPRGRSSFPALAMAPPPAPLRLAFFSLSFLLSVFISLVLSLFLLQQDRKDGKTLYDKLAKVCEEKVGN